MMEFTPEQLERYSRHIILKGVGGKGQKKLLRSKVLIVGAGGLGSPAALYLAAAGVGRIGLVDMDKVELNNLQRQILYHSRDVGKPKAFCAQENLNGLNPDVEIIPYQLKLSSDNIMEIIADYDIVIDGSDNFPTRYLVNDACYFARKPLIHGSIFQFEGMVAVFLPGQGCYRCLYPSPPPPGMVPSCQEAGVLGVLPGVIGVIQATEAIKFLLGIGQLLCRRLLFYDALEMKFFEAKFRANPHCPLCGEKPSITTLIENYEQACGLQPISLGSNERGS